MSQPSLIDVITPFDPTAYATITGAQLQQLVSGVFPYTDKGMVIATTDIAGVPQVPTANATTKWQQYLWLRRTATAVNVYAWNTSAASDAVYLQWVSINLVGIGVGSITGSMIADNTITDSKIANVDWSKVTGFPGSSPIGAAGGDLTGTYPNPVVAPLAITNDKIALNTITHAQIAAKAVEPATDIKPNAVGLALIRTNVGATGCEWFVPQLITLLADPASIADAGKAVVVNPAGTGYELSATATQPLIKRITATDVSIGMFIAATAHGLGGVPDRVEGWLVCTSIDGSYAVGDMIPLSSVFASAPAADGAMPFAPGADSVNVWCTYALQSLSTVYIPTKNANTFTDIIVTILTKWKVKLLAVKYP